MKKAKVFIVLCFMIFLISCGLFYLDNNKTGKSSTIIENSPKPSEKKEDVADEKEIDKTLDEILDQLDELDEVLDSIE